MAVVEPFVTRGQCPLPECEVTLKFKERNEHSYLYVCKHSLVRVGEYFKTMFLGNFKEKDQREIEIKEVSRSDMVLFLRLTVPVENYKAPKPADATELYTLISLADRFLYPKIYQDIVAQLPEWASSWSPSIAELCDLISLGERLLCNDLNKAIADHILYTPALYGESSEVKFGLVQTAYKHQGGSTVILEACIRLCANMDLDDVEKLEGKGMDGAMLAIYAIINKVTPRISDAPKHTKRQCRTGAKTFDILTMPSGGRCWWRCSKCNTQQEATLPFEKIKQLEVKLGLAPVDKGVQNNSSVTMDMGVQNVASSVDMGVQNVASSVDMGVQNVASSVENGTQIARSLTLHKSAASSVDTAVQTHSAEKSRAPVAQAPKPMLIKPPTVPNTVSQQAKTTPPRSIDCHQKEEKNVHHLPDPGHRLFRFVTKDGQPAPADLVQQVLPEIKNKISWLPAGKIVTLCIERKEAKSVLETKELDGAEEPPSTSGIGTTGFVSNKLYHLGGSSYLRIQNGQPCLMRKDSATNEYSKVKRLDRAGLVEKLRRLQQVRKGGHQDYQAILDALNGSGLGVPPKPMCSVAPQRLTTVPISTQSSSSQPVHPQTQTLSLPQGAQIISLPLSTRLVSQQSPSSQTVQVIQLQSQPQLSSAQPSQTLVLQQSSPKRSRKAGSQGEESGETKDETMDTQEGVFLGTRSRPKPGSQSQDIEGSLDLRGPTPKRQRKEPAVISADRYNAFKKKVGAVFGDSRDTLPLGQVISDVQKAVGGAKFTEAELQAAQTQLQDDNAAMINEDENTITMM